MTEIAFPKADVNYLESAAREVGLEVTVPSDIKLAQQHFPRAEGELEPVEAYLLLKIAEHIEAGGQIPKDIVLYLNDRAHCGIPEVDVPTQYRRMKISAFNDLVSAVHEIASQAGKSK